VAEAARKRRRLALFLIVSDKMDRIDKYSKEGER
jgi:hypothetical protein